MGLIFLTLVYQCTKLGFFKFAPHFFLKLYLLEFALREGVAEVAPSYFGDFFVGEAGRLAPATT